MRLLRVRVPGAEEDLATAALWEAGTTGIEVRPVEAGLVDLLAYFPAAVDLASLRASLSSATITPEAVPEVDWVARFREGFRAFRAGGFRIAPVWDAPPPAPDVLVVDPGRAFGTGTHETTRLCLAAVEAIAARRRLGRTLDLGSGTGLLAIAAARLGASPVVASDLDPEATASSRAHARLNASAVTVVRADGASAFRPAAFDLVVANLTAPLLVARAAEIAALPSPAGALVVSGLLAEDVERVRDAYARRGAAEVRRDGEWAALVFGGGR